MSMAFWILPLIAASAPQIHTSETASTRLYVRTVPPGATIVLDGQVLGTSDGLFLVPEGTRRVRIDLEGFRSVVREVQVRGQSITRVEVVLDKPADTAQPPKPHAGFAAASAFLEQQADLPGPARDAMLTVLRQHPGDQRWGGQVGARLFGIAVKPLPEGQVRQRAGPAFLELTHMLAIREMLAAKSLLDRYANTGLTDATTLREAVTQAAGELQVVGQVEGVVHQAAVRGEHAVAYVLADESALSAHLLKPVALQPVRKAYRDVMHRQARDLMARSKWKDALLLWNHLHKRELVSEQLYLDTAKCFVELDQDADALKVLSEAVDTFSESGSPEFFEKAGDVALEIKNDDAQALAEEAYQRAIDALRETISSGAAADSETP